MDAPALEHLEELRKAVRLKRIHISSINTLSFSPLGQLDNLEEVSVYSASRIVNLDGLLPGNAIRELRFEVGGMPDLQSLAALIQLPRLQELTTNGKHRAEFKLKQNEALAAKLGDRWTQRDW